MSCNNAITVTNPKGQLNNQYGRSKLVFDHWSMIAIIGKYEQK